MDQAQREQLAAQQAAEAQQQQQAALLAQQQAQQQAALLAQQQAAQQQEQRQQALLAQQQAQQQQAVQQQAVQQQAVQQQAVQQQAVQQQVVQTPSPVQAAGTPAAQVGDSALIAGECAEEEKLVPEVMCGDMPDITQSVVLARCAQPTLCAINRASSGLSDSVPVAPSDDADLYSSLWVTPWTTCSPTCKTDIQNVVTKIGCCFTKLFSNDERSSIVPSAGVLIV